MEQFWSSDSKYASHGVDGSLCSFITYLSEVSSYVEMKMLLYLHLFSLSSIKRGEDLVVC